MVEIFFFVFSDASITDTDRLLQIFGKKALNRYRISLLKCSAESIQLRSFLADFFLEPFVYLFCKDFLDYSDTLILPQKVLEEKSFCEQRNCQY